MKIKLAVYRTNSGTHVSQYNEPSDHWLHRDDVRITEIVEVDFPARPQTEIDIDVEAIRTAALARIRKLQGEAA